MIRNIYKSRMQCPECEGCGHMACRDKDSLVYKLKISVCKICNGTGIINGYIEIKYDDLKAE